MAQSRTIPVDLFSEFDFADFGDKLQHATVTSQHVGYQPGGKY